MLHSCDSLSSYVRNSYWRHSGRKLWNDALVWSGTAAQRWWFDNSDRKATAAPRRFSSRRDIASTCAAGGDGRHSRSDSDHWTSDVSSERLQGAIMAGALCWWRGQSRGHRRVYRNYSRPALM